MKPPRLVVYTEPVEEEPEPIRIKTYPSDSEDALWFRSVSRMGTSTRTLFGLCFDADGKVRICRYTGVSDPRFALDGEGRVKLMEENSA